MKPDIVETLLLITILIISLILLYGYWHKQHNNNNNNNILESFNNSNEQITTLFDLEDMEYKNTPEWSNYVKNHVTQTELPISIWTPAITDTTSYKIIGHSTHNLYNKPNNIKPVVIKIKNTTDTPLPTKLKKVFEFGANSTTTSSYTRNINTKDDYDNFLTGTDINYKTTTPVTYTTNDQYTGSFYYDNNPNSGIIYEIDYSKASIQQVIAEIAACNATLLKNADFLTSTFKQKFKNMKFEFTNPYYLGSRYPYNIDPDKTLEVDTIDRSINYYNWINIHIPKGFTVEIYSAYNFAGYKYVIPIPIDATLNDLSKYAGGFPGGITFDGDKAVLEGWRGDIFSMKLYINNDTFTKLIGTTDMDVKMKEHINNLNSQLTLMNNFKNTILNKSIEIPSFSCWEPVAPENHTAIGHVIYPQKNMSSSDLVIEGLRTSMACVPKHCYRKVRDWVASDIIYRYNKDGQYFAIYKNPFTNTFVGTTNQTGPDGFVGKVIICPKKDYTIDNIISFDKKIRTNCSNYKNITNKSQLVSDDYNNDADAYLQKQIYNKQKKLQELSEYADSLELANSTGTIVNQELNRSKLSSYLDNQRDRIDTSLKLLEVGRNKIDVNIKYPPSVIIQVIDYVSNSPEIPIETKVELVATLKQIQESSLSSDDARKNIIAALTTCPQFDLGNYIKKDPPCFGCYLSS